MNVRRTFGSLGVALLAAIGAADVAVAQTAVAHSRRGDDARGTWSIAAVSKHGSDISPWTVTHGSR